MSLERVGNDVPLTEQPVVGARSADRSARAARAGPVRCPDCGYRNMPAWQRCYACGGRLGAVKVVGAAAGQAADFVRERLPFRRRQGGDGTWPPAGSQGPAAGQGHTRPGTARQDWSGYDYLKADVFTEAQRPVNLYVEIRDQQTRDYWTRVNYEHASSRRGRSTLVLPLDQLYVGEKARPGPQADGQAASRAGAGHRAKARPRRSTSTTCGWSGTNRPPRCSSTACTPSISGPASSPVMPGFTRIDPSTIYSKGRGYGLKDAQIWRAFDVLQPDPLYQDFICIEKGGLAVDVPDGKYHVFVNIDNPSGFWGEYQVYRQRAVLAQGKVGGRRSDDLRVAQEEILPLLGRPRTARRKHLRQVPEGLLPGEGVRRRRDRAGS